MIIKQDGCFRAINVAGNGKNCEMSKGTPMKSEEGLMRGGEDVDAEKLFRYLS